MKVLMVLESGFPPDIRVENEAKSLIEAGHQIHIACLKTMQQENSEKYKGIYIQRFSINKLVHKSSVGALKFPFYFNFWREKLESLIKKESFDAIHIHDLPLASLGHKLSKKYKLKYILDLHENWPALLNISTHTKSFLGKILCSIPKWEQYEAKNVAKADHVIVVVDEAKKRLIDLGLSSDKISVVSNTLNMELFSFPEQIKDPNFVTLVYGGGINYHRGLQYAIEAIPKIIDAIPNIRLWIIGDGNYLGKLKELAKSFNVSEYVKFWGWMNQGELLELISQSNYAMIPHIRSPHTDATIPHKIFQYMYAGIPVISSNCLPLKRILTETGTGLCFQDKNPDSFADTFLKLIEKETRAERTVKSGKEWVMEKYNWEIDSGILSRLYVS